MHPLTEPLPFGIYLPTLLCKVEEDGGSLDVVQTESKGTETSASLYRMQNIMDAQETLQVCFYDLSGRTWYWAVSSIKNWSQNSHLKREAKDGGNLRPVPILFQSYVQYQSLFARLHETAVTWSAPKFCV